MLSYFDLNNKVQKDLAMFAKTLPAESASKEESKLSVQQQLSMYLGLLVGVIFSTAVNQFKKGETANLNMDIATSSFPP